MRSGSRCPAFYGEIPPMRWGILNDDGGYFYCITYTQISRSYPRICMKLNGKFGMDLADQLGRRDGEPFREPAELLLRNLQYVFGLSGH